MGLRCSERFKSAICSILAASTRAQLGAPRRWVVWMELIFRAKCDLRNPPPLNSGVTPYAGTPNIRRCASLPVAMSVLRLQFNFKILTGDVSTAFLHAPTPNEYYVVPPKEYYPMVQICGNYARPFMD